MVGDPEHPIATPKGASAFSVLLAVVGVFGPFLFTVQAAMVFAAVAVLVLVWIYWGEGVAALRAREWSAHLNVPLGSVVAIILMGVITLKGASDNPAKPAPAPALSAEDVAARVVGMLRDQVRSENAPPPQIIVRDPGPPIVVEIPARQSASAEPSPQIQEETRQLTKLAEDMQKRHERAVASDARSRKCFDQIFSVSEQIVPLIMEASKAQNAFASTGNEAEIVSAYDSWINKANSIVYSNREFIGDISAFESAKPEIEDRSLFSARRRGNTAWYTFRAKSDALREINNSIVKTDCRTTN